MQSKHRAVRGFVVCYAEDYPQLGKWSHPHSIQCLQGAAVAQRSGVGTSRLERLDAGQRCVIQSRRPAFRSRRSSIFVADFCRLPCVEKRPAAAVLRFTKALQFVGARYPLQTLLGGIVPAVAALHGLRGHEMGGVYRDAGCDDAGLRAGCFGRAGAWREARTKEHRGAVRALPLIAAKRLYVLVTRKVSLTRETPSTCHVVLATGV